MPECFISYRSCDSELARTVHDMLQTYGIDTFLAEASIPPGADWTNEVWTALRASERVVFLASREACRSPFVQQELGAALGDGKPIIPLVWDMPPSELPGWVSKHQAIDISGLSTEQLRDRLSAIAESGPAKDSSFEKLLWLVGAMGILLVSLGSARKHPGEPPEGACRSCWENGTLSLLGPIPHAFVALEDATHECPTCRHKCRVAQFAPTVEEK